METLDNYKDYLLDSYSNFPQERYVNISAGQACEALESAGP